MNKKNLIADDSKEPLKLGHYKKTPFDKTASNEIKGDNSPHSHPIGKFRKK